MSKTNPIGVRFRDDILELLKKNHGIETPQRALVFLERFYAQHSELAKDITQVLRKQALKPNNEPKPILPTNPQKPKNLEELKALCPPELTGLDRSAWISLQRQKHGI